MIERLPKLNLLTEYSKEKNTLLSYWTLLYYNKYLYYFFNFFLKRGKKMISIKLIYLLLQKIKEYTMLPPVLVLQGALLNYRHLLKLRVLKYRRKSIYKYIFLSPEKQIKMSINYLAQRFSSFNLPGVQYGALDRLAVFVLNLFFKTSLVYGRFLSNNIHMYTLINESKRKRKRRKKLKKRRIKAKKKQRKANTNRGKLTKKRRFRRKKKISRLKRKLIFTLKRRLFKKRRRKKFRFKKKGWVRLKRKITKFYFNMIKIKDARKNKYKTRSRSKKLFLHLLRRSLLQWFRWTRVSKAIRKNHLTLLLRKDIILQKTGEAHNNSIVITHLHSCIKHQLSVFLNAVEKSQFVRSNNRLYTYLFILHIYTRYIVHMDQINLVNFLRQVTRHKTLRRVVFRSFYLFLARTRFIQNYLRLSEVRKNFIQRRRVFSYRIFLLSKLCNYLKTTQGLQVFSDLSLSPNHLLSALSSLQYRYKNLFRIFRNKKRFFLLNRIKRKGVKENNVFNSRLMKSRKKIFNRTKKEQMLNLYIKRLNSTISLRRLNVLKGWKRRFFLFSKVYNKKTNELYNSININSFSRKYKAANGAHRFLSIFHLKTAAEKSQLIRFLSNTFSYYRTLPNTLPLNYSLRYFNQQRQIKYGFRFLKRKNIRELLSRLNSTIIKKKLKEQASFKKATSPFKKKLKKGLKRKLRYKLKKNLRSMMKKKSSRVMNKKFFSRKKVRSNYRFQRKHLKKCFRRSFYLPNIKVLLGMQDKANKKHLVTKLNKTSMFTLIRFLRKKVKEQQTTGERNRKTNKINSVSNVNMSNVPKNKIVNSAIPSSNNTDKHLTAQKPIGLSAAWRQLIPAGTKSIGNATLTRSSLGVSDKNKNSHKRNTNRTNSISLVTKRYKNTYIFSDSSAVKNKFNQNTSYKKNYKTREPRPNPFTAILDVLEKSISVKPNTPITNVQKSPIGNYQRTGNSRFFEKKRQFRHTGNKFNKFNKYNQLPSKEEVFKQVQRLFAQADSLIRESGLTKNIDNTISRGMKHLNAITQKKRKLIKKLKKDKNFAQLSKIKAFLLAKKNENNYIFKVKQLVTRGLVLGLYVKNRNVLQGGEESNTLSLPFFSFKKINVIEHPHLIVLKNFMESVDDSYKNLKLKISTLVRRINIRFETRNQLRFKYRRGVLPVSVRAVKNKVQERYFKLFKTAAIKKSLKRKKTYLSDFDYLLGLYELYQDQSSGYKPTILETIKSNKTTPIATNAIKFYKKLILRILFRRIYRIIERVYSKITSPFWHLFVLRTNLLRSFVTSKFHSKIEVKSVDDSFLSNLIYYLNNKKSYLTALPVQNSIQDTWSPQSTFLTLYDQRSDVENILLRQINKTMKHINPEATSQTELSDEVESVQDMYENNFYLERVEGKVKQKQLQNKNITSSFSKKFSYLSYINTEDGVVSLLQKQKKKLLAFAHRFSILRTNRLRRLTKFNLLSCVNRIRRYYYYLLRFKLIKVLWFSLNFNMRRKSIHRRVLDSRVNTVRRFMLKRK